MDYEGEQAMELEALEAIFPDQLEEWEGSRPEGWSAHGKTWAITIHPAAGVCVLCVLGVCAVCSGTGQQCGGRGHTAHTAMLPPSRATARPDPNPHNPQRSRTQTLRRRRPSVRCSSCGRTRPPTQVRGRGGGRVLCIACVT